jgi:hypothetical protein
LTTPKDLKNYILTDEIVELGMFTQNNISIMLKTLEEGVDYLKYSHIRLLNKESIKKQNIDGNYIIPKNIRDIVNICMDDFTKLDNAILKDKKLDRFIIDNYNNIKKDILEVESIIWYK